MIFEDDEKENIELDASISSDDTEGISWDDLLDGTFMIKFSPF